MPACPVPVRPFLPFIANRKISIRFPLQNNLYPDIVPKIFTCFFLGGGGVMICNFTLPVTPSLALGRLRRLLYVSMLTGDTNR